MKHKAPCQRLNSRNPPKKGGTLAGGYESPSDSSGVRPAPAPAPKETTSDSDRPKLERRVAIANLALSGLVLITGVPTFLNEVEEWHQRRKEAIEREGELRDLLIAYLYPSNSSGDHEVNVPLIPAMSDRWGPPNRQFSGSGRRVAAAYVSAFRSPNNLRIIQQDHDIDVGADDAPVLISSHLVNEPSARYFGDPQSSKAIHKPRFRDVDGGFEADLRWTIYAPEGAKVVSKRELFQGVPTIRTEPVHKLSDAENPKLRQPTFVAQGGLDWQRDDYLLITVLPRDSRFDRRVISLAGLHKPGTLAAAQFLGERELSLNILREINKRVKYLQYFQALIQVSVNYNGGLPNPAGLNLIDAQAIKITRMSHPAPPNLPQGHRRLSL